MTKARTKAERRRLRHGRPRIEDAPREPNGRVSRSGIPHDPAELVALQARVRHTGLTAQQARDQKAGTFIGYLNILGRRDGLSDAQYDALIEFLDLRSDYLKAIKAPNAMQQSGVAGGVGDEVSHEYIQWCSRVRERYEECRRAIQEAQNENRSENLWAALDYCVVRDEWHSHMIPWLRVLSNALVRFFGG